MRRDPNRRIRYGDEDDDWGANEHPYHDCGVVKGELHRPGGDVERCPGCDGQLIACDCESDEGGVESTSRAEW